MAIAKLQFDRRVSESLLDALTAPFSSLIAHRNSDPRRFDLQLRKSARGSTCWASLYYGLTTVLDLVESNGQYRCRAHATHRAAGDLPDETTRLQPLEELVERWASVEAYLDRVIPRVNPRHYTKEGAVHAAMCAGTATAYRVLDRESTIGFPDQPTRDRITAQLAAPIHSALDAAGRNEPWWPGAGERPHARLGTGLDLLATDANGRLLVIEAKPPSATAGITHGPVQVRFYAELFARWADQEPEAAPILSGMLDQRATLGLTRPGPPIAEPIRIPPVLAIGGAPHSTKALPRAIDVAQALAPPASSSVAPFEVWILDDTGEPAEVIDDLP